MPLYDPIQMEIFSQRLLSITEEMGAQLVRSSFSPNIKERRDCSVALFDASGQVIAQAAHIPIHLGSLVGGVASVLAAYPVAQMCPGDAFVCNDAYLSGGTHLPDIAIITPVFVDDEVCFFAANLGHHADVGGPTPGSISHSARSIFAEGVRIPATRIAAAGTIDKGVIGLIAHNTREPQERMLDLRVQIATNQRGAQQLHALCKRIGVAQARSAADDLLRYTSARLRQHIAKLEDGEYSYTTWMDHDGLGGPKLPICATVIVDGENLELDFDGTGAQSRGAYNVMPSGVLATVAYALIALLDPELSPNSGLFVAVKLRIPEGSILNPRFPAAVGARTTTCQKLAGAIFGAFRGLLPAEQHMADSHDVLAGMVFSGTRTDGSTYVYLETVGGGNGARSDMDGMHAAHVHITNSLNMPIEAVEIEYPLRVEEYALVRGSGGSGQFRGGQGIAREVRILQANTTFSARADSFETCAQGLAGGGNGSHARVILNARTDSETIVEPRQSALALQVNDTVRMETPGGAGVGSADQRRASLTDADHRDERV